MLGVHVPLVNLTQKLVQGVLQDVVVLSKENKTIGPLCWSSGQHSCLLLRRSELESCWLFKFFEQKTKKNEKEAGVGPS